MNKIDLNLKESLNSPNFQIVVQLILKSVTEMIKMEVCLYICFVYLIHRIF